jgi:hypothetical protein
MSPTLELALIVTLAGMLAIASAAAGVLWSRLRSAPLVRAAHLARELAERQRALEALIERLERPAKRGREPSFARGGATIRPGLSRVDPAQATAVAGPTLIAVPDLSAPASPAASAAAELAGRFGAIWERAERGESADAIARATGQPIGQVELILGLRRQLSAAAEGRP